MRRLRVLIGIFALATGFLIQPAAAEDAPKAAASPARTCSANSADKLQTCSVSCPEGKTATCVGGAQGAKDVDCACK